MLIPILILINFIILSYIFRSTWLHLFEESHSEIHTAEMYNKLDTKQLCTKCGEEMEEGRAIINYRDNNLPFLCPHEGPTFLRRNVRTAPTLTENPSYPDPQTVYRCHVCGIFLDHH
jgi:hypothetical protein